jgi:hypothetical protein
MIMYLTAIVSATLGLLLAGVLHKSGMCRECERREYLERERAAAARFPVPGLPSKDRN